MTAKTPPVGNDANIRGSGRPPDHDGPHEGESAYEHYGDVPDPRATSDPSSPQGAFWSPEEATRVEDEIAAVELDESDGAHPEPALGTDAEGRAPEE